MLARLAFFIITIMEKGDSIETDDAFGVKYILASRLRWGWSCECEHRSFTVHYTGAQAALLDCCWPAVCGTVNIDAASYLLSTALSIKKQSVEKFKMIYEKYVIQKNVACLVWLSNILALFLQQLGSLSLPIFAARFILLSLPLTSLPLTELLCNLTN
jgi:hypothetical protein